MSGGEGRRGEGRRERERGEEEREGGEGERRGEEERRRGEGERREEKRGRGGERRGGEERGKGEGEYRREQERKRRGSNNITHGHICTNMHIPPLQTQPDAPLPRQHTYSLLAPRGCATSCPM